MAYEKKTVQEYIAETDDKTVEGFNDNQEDRINNAIGDMVDYVIETGSNSLGNWEMWQSGKMVQWGRKEDTTSGSGYTGITFPKPSVSGTERNLFTSLYGYDTRLHQVNAYSDPNLNYADVYVSLAGNPSASLLVAIDWYVISKWK